MKSKLKNSAVKGAIDESATNRGPLHGKSVYLDLLHHKNVADLEKKLHLVGATVERCFSRDVSSVITDRETTSVSGVKKEMDQLCTSANGDSSLHVVSPSSAASPASRNLFGNVNSSVQRSMCPSPLCHSSPAYSPSLADGPGRPVTRGQVIAQKANLTRSYGSTNVLECAKQWGIRVVGIHKAEKWLDKEIDKLPKKAKVKEPKAKVHKISEPNLKVEDVNRRHRPQFQRLQSMPTVRLHGILGLGVFEEPVSCPNEDVQEVIPLSKSKRVCGSDAGTAKVISPCHSSVSKRKLVVKRGAGIKLRVTTTTHRLQESKMKNKNRYGFCEICDVNYEDVKVHCKSELHREKSSDASMYRQLDSVIDDGLTLRSLLSQHVLTVSPFRSGRVDGCDESPEVNIASTPNSLKKSAFRPSRVRLLPVRSVLRDSPHRPRVNNVTCSTASCHYTYHSSKTSKMDNTVCSLPQTNTLQGVITYPNEVSRVMSVGSQRCSSAAGRVSPEIPVVGRISRTPKKLNMRPTSDVNNLKQTIVSSLEASRIHCSDISSWCDAYDFGLSVSSNQSSSTVVDVELLSLRSSPAKFISLYDDYLNNDCYSLPFNGFDDCSESETHYIESLSDMEVFEFDRSNDSCYYFSSDWGTGPRPSAGNSPLVTREVAQTCSDSIEHSCKILLSETHQNMVELMTDLDGFNVNERLDHEVVLGSDFGIPNHASNTVDLTHEEGHASSVVSQCTGYFSGEESITNAVDGPGNRCQVINNNENKTVRLCSPPIPSTPDSGCRCWKPVICISKLSRPV